VLKVCCDSLLLCRDTLGYHSYRNAFLFSAVWDFESGLNINKQDDVSMNYMKTNSCSFKSENSEISSASHTSSSSEIG
jgi:hypothetical protein